MKKTLYLLLGIIVLFCAPVALAAHTCPAGVTASHDPISGIALPCTPTTSTAFYTMIQTVFNVVFGVLIMVASFMLLYAAFEYITAQGNEEKLGKAKNMIVYAIVAIVVGIFAWGLPRVVIGFFGGGAAGNGLTCAPGTVPNATNTGCISQ